MESIENNQDYLDKTFNKLDVAEGEFKNITFEQCEFHQCDFSSVNLSHCKFVNCLFDRCNLSLAYIPNTRFSNTEFIGCKLVGIDWTKAHWPRFDLYSQLSFKSSILSGCNFFGLKLYESVFDDCRLHDVDFRNAELNKSIMTGSDFTNSLFMQTNIEAVDFTDSHSFDIDIRQNKIAKAKFSKFEALDLLRYLDIKLVD
ncbi:pentapeptide repeat-containing protein [Proteus vulgaris]|uniref:Pentapeptide repeat-containing protein n=1 Tax=Proteus vulgaris TaxID=585 RepID=A0A6G6SJI1_PROVU|nr:pentapeptide repeat-containing protein [Proteus vulgaris]QIF93906.1 pentapeptide repeat-containing protein [Proteus vulgaris]CRL59154.1 Pentapeptide repeats (8 copies) [Proteus vulgaris]